MKPRKVVVIMEVLTDIPIKALKELGNWRFILKLGEYYKIQQIQVNVVKQKQK